MPEIKILKHPGVSGVNVATEVLAREAAKLKPMYTLDMGTGTGYVAIYLS